MIQAKCIQKFKDFNGNIKCYVLMDIKGQTIQMSVEELKRAIAQEQIYIINLTLTSDGRLVNKSSTEDVPKEVIHLRCLYREKEHKCRDWMYTVKDLSGNIKTFSLQLLYAGMQRCYYVENVTVHCDGLRIHYTKEQIEKLNELEKMYKAMIDDISKGAGMKGGSDFVAKKIMLEAQYEGKRKALCRQF